jgi:hypothetical protein
MIPELLAMIRGPTRSVCFSEPKPLKLAQNTPI